MQKPSKPKKSHMRKIFTFTLCVLLVLAVVFFIKTYQGAIFNTKVSTKNQQQAFEQKLEALRQDVQIALSNQPNAVQIDSNSELQTAYLLTRTAAMSLQNGQNIEIAKTLLQVASQHLSNVNGPKAEQAKRILDADKAKLNAIKAPDMRKLQEQLAILDKLINVLPANGANTAINKDNTPETKTNAKKQQPWYLSVQNVFGDLKSVVKIRKKEAHEVTLTEIDMARAQFKLIIEQLRWAAFYNNPAVYEHSLQNAKTLLPQIFDMHSESVKKFADTLDELQNIKLYTEIPSIENSVNALQAIIAG